MINHVELIESERLEKYITEAARSAGYENGFGIKGCDLSQNHFWAAYTRQSTREQSENNRLAEYLLQCAQLAKQYGVIVPKEFILYDASTSEDMNRQGIEWLRRELIPNRRIAGVLIPLQGRLSDNPLDQLTFEYECKHYQVKVIYGDAPSGDDSGSRMTRILLSLANGVRVKSNRDNVLAGNKARVMSGKVPAHRAPYGFLLKTEKIIDQRNGRTKVLKALWEIGEIDSSGQAVLHTPAWVVQQIFIWLGEQGRTAYWVAAQLNQLGIKPPQGPTWNPRTVIKIASRRCYTGKAQYNVNGLFPNPNRPVGDPTLGDKRTLQRPKPENERVSFDVPVLTTEHLWLMANQSLKERGRGRGKAGKSISALFRARMLCPKCYKPMSVKLKEKGSNSIYYYCREHSYPWAKNPCDYRKFIPATWDEDIWQELCQLLQDDEWIELQLASESKRFEAGYKLVKIEENKIQQVKREIGKVQDGFAIGIYNDEEAKAKIEKLRGLVRQAETEIGKLSDRSNKGAIDIDALKQELVALRNSNLANASFENRLELVSRLGIRIIPSEDLKSRRICCNLTLVNNIGKEGNIGYAKVTFGGPFGTVPELLFEKKQLIPALQQFIVSL